MPPMTIRNAKYVNDGLGFSTLPNDFVSVPITTYLDYNMNDWGSCKWVDDTTSARSGDNNVFSDYWYIGNFAM